MRNSNGIGQDPKLEQLCVERIVQVRKDVDNIDTSRLLTCTELDYAVQSAERLLLNLKVAQAARHELVRLELAQRAADKAMAEKVAKAA